MVPRPTKTFYFSCLCSWQGCIAQLNLFKLGQLYSRAYLTSELFKGNTRPTRSKNRKCKYYGLQLTDFNIKILYRNLYSYTKTTKVMLEADCQLSRLKFTHLRCMICQNYLLCPTDLTKKVYLTTLVVVLSNNSKTDNWAITKCYIIDYHEKLSLYT